MRMNVVDYLNENCMANGERVLDAEEGLEDVQLHCSVQEADGSVHERILSTNTYVGILKELGSPIN